MGFPKLLDAARSVSPRKPGSVLWCVPSEGSAKRKVPEPSLDRLAGGGVSFAGSGEERPPKWNGRPGGAGEAAVPQQPYRGCLAARGSTLTSWRSGRLGHDFSRWGRAVRVRASCAEDGASGWCWCGGRAHGSCGPGSHRLAQQQQSASEVRGHHTQRRRRQRAIVRCGSRCDASAS